ncbi:TolC family protein [Colwellia psychrerythraea]|uniref:Outer membrane efflux protein n=1 Tax=Colwellia psychrerythraea TaxID=28229 RepID=A0A099KND5_COLPS|nr:TolC family protein [Colwellia psychrerythraea]KGJ91740.1 outer membrane efflux protein [Colwellia psychrerythraea]
MFLYYYRSLITPSHVGKIASLLVCTISLLLSPYSLAKDPTNTDLDKINNAQATESKILTLAVAIKRTLKENPAFKVFTLRQAALDGQQQTQALAPGYQLAFEAENFAGTGELKGFDGAEFTVSLSSVIEMGGKRDARRDLGAHRSTMLAAERKITALTLLAEVTRRYIDVLAAQESLQLAFDATSLAEEALMAVEKRAKAGSTPKAEIKRAMAAVGNARLSASSKQQQFIAAKMSLALLWNESWNEKWNERWNASSNENSDDNSPTFDTVAGNLYHFSKDVSFEQLYAKIQQNPAILAFANEERLKSAQLRLAKSQSSTDIQWTLGVKQIQDVGDTALVAGFSIPLFSSSNNSGAIMSAQAERDEVQARKITALLNLHNQLQQAYSSRKQAIYTANSLRNTIIPLLEEALAETQISYQSGLYSYLDYLNARQELLLARQSLIKSATAALRFGADIEQLIAEPLPASQHFQPQASQQFQQQNSFSNNRFTQG